MMDKRKATEKLRRLLNTNFTEKDVKMLKLNYKK